MPTEYSNYFRISSLHPEQTYQGLYNITILFYITVLLMDIQEDPSKMKREGNGWNYKMRNFIISLSIIARVIMQKIMSPIAHMKNQGTVSIY
jgi:hypothetical protein